MKFGSVLLLSVLFCSTAKAELRFTFAGPEYYDALTSAVTEERKSWKETLFQITAVSYLELVCSNDKDRCDILIQLDSGQGSAAGKGGQPFFVVRYSGIVKGEFARRLRAAKWQPHPRWKDTVFFGEDHAESLYIYCTKGEDSYCAIETPEEVR